MYCQIFKITIKKNKTNNMTRLSNSSNLMNNFIIIGLLRTDRINYNFIFDLL